MTKKEFKKLKPGDKVKIVRERVAGMNCMGGMDKWLGKVMTVKEHTIGDNIHMVEDQNEIQGGWYWSKNMIERKIPEAENPSDAAIDKLAEGMFGKPLKDTAKERVQKELAELEERIEKLSHAFAPLADKLGTETEAYSLLNLQLGAMRTYADILRRRLEIWKG